MSRSSEEFRGSEPSVRPPRSGEGSPAAEPAPPRGMFQLPKKDGRLRLYTVDDLKRTPSIALGMSLEAEKKARSDAVSFILNAGKKLRMSSAAQATAAVFLHHFYMRYPFQKFAGYEIASACLFCAMKIEDSKQDIRIVAQICLETALVEKLEPHTDDPKELQMRSKEFQSRILDEEFLLLQTIEFNLRPRHAYSQCMTILKKIFADQKVGKKSEFLKGDITSPKSVQDLHNEIAQLAWWFINESLKSTLCLTAKPIEIAIACIQAAGDFPLTSGGTVGLVEDWWKSLEPTLTRERYEEIANEFISMVEEQSSMRPKSYEAAPSPSTN